MHWKKWVAEKSEDMDLVDFAVTGMMVLIAVGLFLFLIGSLILMAIQGCKE